MELGFGQVSVRGNGEVIIPANRLSVTYRACSKTHQSN